MTGADWQDIFCIAVVSVCVGFLIRYLWRG